MDRNEDRLNSVAAEIVEGGYHAPLVIVADITENAEHIINKTIEHFGQLDVLVNNAAVVARSDLASLDMDEFDLIMNTNVRSIVVLTQAAIPHLTASKGNIVNVSSLTGLRVCPSMLAYSMSKVGAFTALFAFVLIHKILKLDSFL